MSFPICIAQLGFGVGDLSGNVRKILDAAAQAHAEGARVLLTPELALSGYAAQDLFLRPAFLDACERALAELALASVQWDGLVLVVGHPARVAAAPGDGLGQRLCHNAASVLRGGRIEHTYAKQSLPSYQVFDEVRHFLPGPPAPCVFDVDGVRFGVLICEDAWLPGAAQRTAQAGAQALLVLNASPYHLGKPAQREQAMRERVRETGLPLVYAHAVLGHDELVFDGHSFALQRDGSVALRVPGFEQKLAFAQVQKAQAAIELRAHVAPFMPPELELWHALVLALRDYVGKNGFPGVLLGFSGGMDSALVLALAVDALGADRVRTVMMPSHYTAGISVDDAGEMARRLGVRHQEIAIAPLFDAFRAALAADFAGLPEDTTEENLQARIRGMLLMALSNKSGAMVLSTGNKSELATGYCTLYGDMAGGFAPIKDVPKTRVYDLARWRNAHDPFGTGANPIPERIITRAPSAELRDNQTDQDSLPPYEVLDAILERYMERNASIEDVIAAGYARADVLRVTRLVQINEYKRRQAPIGPRVTRRAFGADWRQPITNAFRG